MSFKRGELRPCELCGHPKGYPVRMGENVTRADGSVYYWPSVKWICYPCREEGKRNGEEMHRRTMAELEAQRDEMAIKADDWAKGIRR